MSKDGKPIRRNNEITDGTYCEKYDHEKYAKYDDPKYLNNQDKISSDED